jgi:hypothetical protein
VASGDSVAVAADSGASTTTPRQAGTPATDTSATPRQAAPARPNTPTATPTPTAAPTPAPSENVITGKVVAGGLAENPVTSLQVEGRGPMTLVGPLEAELRRLGGATVWVAGAPATSGPNGSFTVTRYDVVLVNGERPKVGTLSERAGGLWLAGTDTVKLAAVPAALQGKSGAKVWIIGRRNGAELVVQSFGILREP